MKKLISVIAIVVCLLFTSCNKPEQEVPHENFNFYSSQIESTIYSLYYYNHGPYRIFPEIERFDVLCSLPTCTHIGDCVSNPQNTVCSIDTDGKNIYMFYTKLDANDNKYKNILLKFNLESQTQTTLYEFPSGGYPAIVYTHNNYVYFYSLSEDNYYLTRIKSTGSSKIELTDIPYCNSYGVAFWGDKIYYIENGVYIKCYDTDTMKSSLIYQCNESNGEATRIYYLDGKLYITYSSTLPGIEGGIEEYFVVNRTSELNLTTGSERFINNKSDTTGYMVSSNIIFYREFKRTPTGETYFWTNPETGETNEYLSLARNEEYSIYDITTDTTTRFSAPEAFIWNFLGVYEDDFIVEAKLTGEENRQFYKLIIRENKAVFQAIEGTYP